MKNYHPPKSIRALIYHSVIWMVCFLFITSNVVAQKILILNTADDPPLSMITGTGICDRIVTEAFRRIGTDLEIVHLPSERALQNANDGIDDGNFVRVGGLIQSLYPNLIQVNEPIIEFEFTVFSKNTDSPINGWESLEPFNVGIVTGWKILEKNISKTKTITTLTDSEILFRMLQENRIDMAVYDLRQGMYLINKMSFTNIKAISPPLIIENMYIYLHKKNRTLVHPLIKALKQMKQDGTYQKIVNDTLKELE